MVPTVRIELTYSRYEGEVMPLYQIGVNGTLGEIRTHTGQGLNLPPLPDWATRAYMVLTDGLEPPSTSLQKRNFSN